MAQRKYWVLGRVLLLTAQDVIDAIARILVHDMSSRLLL